MLAQFPCQNCLAPFLKVGIILESNIKTAQISSTELVRFIGVVRTFPPSTRYKRLRYSQELKV